MDTSVKVLSPFSNIVTLPDTSYRLQFSCSLFVFFSLLFSFPVISADFVATLDSSDGSSAFVFNDSGDNTVISLDSDGNVQIRGGLRLDTSGVKCSSAETLIVDGKIGIGVTDPFHVLEVNGTVEALGFSGPGIIKQVQSVCPAADTSTTSTSFVDLDGMSITMATGDSLLMILWDAVIHPGGNWAATECLVDGVRAGSIQGAYDSVDHVHQISGNVVKTVSAGSHTIKIRWRLLSGSMDCNPTSSPDLYGRTLTVLEISR